MPCNGYIAGRAVSRWDTDSDNIDIDYRTLSGHGSACDACAHCIKGRGGCVVRGLIVIITFLLGFLISYVLVCRHTCHFSHSLHCNHTTQQVPALQDYSESVAHSIQSHLDNKSSYEEHIRSMAHLVKLAGSAANNDILRNYVKKSWDALPLDKVTISDYNVQLSYPDMSVLSYVSLMSANGSTVFHSHDNHTPDHPEYVAFNAFSPTKTVSSQLVYARYGTREDFEVLKGLGVSVRGYIALVRYGKIHPSIKVREATREGATGVIFYCDPYDFTPNGNTSGTIHGWSTKSAQVAFVSVGHTMSLSYTAQGKDINVDKSSYPTIPSHPVSYNDAKILLGVMGGDRAPDSWQGSLNVTYRLGPGFISPLTNGTVKLAVYNSLTMRTISNAVAIIYGSIEKDKYVIVGSHHDSWRLGAVHVGTSVAVLMELVNAISLHTQRGWRPRRTIIFALWGASEYGHMGAWEWVQQYTSELSAGAVAYINLDAAIVGSYSFTSDSDPLLTDLIMAATASVTSPDLHNSSVLDVWMTRFPSSNSLPRMPYPKADGDHAPFEYNIGVPTATPSYTYNTKLYPNVMDYPVAGTLDDTFDYIHKFIDPTMTHHATVAKVVADMVLRLSDSLILPLSPKHYTSLLAEGWHDVQKYRTVIESHNIDLVVLKTSIDAYTSAIGRFCSYLQSLDKSSITELQADEINHKLMRLSRLFIAKSPLEDNPNFRSVLISPDPEGGQRYVIFPGVTHAATHSAHSLPQQFSHLVHSLNSATRLINDTPFL